MANAADILADLTNAELRNLRDVHLHDARRAPHRLTAKQRADMARICNRELVRRANSN